MHRTRSRQVVGTPQECSTAAAQASFPDRGSSATKLMTFASRPADPAVDCRPPQKVQRVEAARTALSAADANQHLSVGFVTVEDLAVETKGFLLDRIAFVAAKESQEVADCFAGSGLAKKTLSRVEEKQNPPQPMILDRKLLAEDVSVVLSPVFVDLTSHSQSDRHRVSEYLERLGYGYLLCPWPVDGYRHRPLHRSILRTIPPRCRLRNHFLLRLDLPLTPPAG